MKQRILPLLLASAVSIAAIPAVAETVAKPISAGGVMAIDLPASSAQSVSLDIVKGRFADYSVGRVTITGNGIDFRNGTLQGLRADVKDGHFENVMVDSLQIATGAFSFNTMELLNNRTFVLNQPVTATVHMKLTEENLNSFIRNPKTIEKIESAIAKKMGGLKLITFSNPGMDLLGGGKVKVTVTGVVAQGAAVPMEMTGNLGLKDGQLVIRNLNLSSNGTALPLPVDVAKVFEQKLNEMIDFKKLGKNRLVITGDKVSATGDTLTVEGHATLTRLSFG